MFVDKVSRQLYLKSDSKLLIPYHLTSCEMLENDRCQLTKGQRDG